MCGICGFLDFSSNPQPDRKVVLARMCYSIRHRGPDDEGAYLDENIALGIRRLKIIDLETGHQPIHNEDETIWVVFNGEIYNFLELKDILMKRGHRFYTRTDTEVLVHLYEEYGEEFLKQLNGMFALALWDKNKQRLLLARDRLGKKPLYYSVIGGKLIFASEIKAILEFPGIVREIDFSSLAKYLAYEFVPAPHSIFKNIKKLLPGYFLVINKSKITETKYWDVDYASKSKNKDIRETILRLRELLKEAVNRRLISDVPLGVFLSGGLDSSTVVALMSEVSPSPIKTFTIGFEDRSFDEIKYARRIAKRFSTEHHERILEPNRLLDLIPQVGKFLDEPLGDASIIPTYLLSLVTRENITVALSGDGGDELFAGYPTYQAHKLARYYEKIPSFIRRNFIENVIKGMPVSFDNFSLDFKAKKFISGIAYPPDIRHYIWLGSFTPQEERSLLNKDLSELASEDKVFSELTAYPGGLNSENQIDRAMYLDLKLYLQDDILVKADRASMAASLEVRSPFLDYKLVEFMAGLPADLKLYGLRSKFILKKAMQGTLPGDILNRDKKGFGIPVAKWICKELKPLILEVFSESKLKKEGIFNPPYVQMLLKEHFSGRQDNRKKIWTLFMFELWHQNYLYA